MQINDFITGVTANITNKVVKRSISPANIGNAFTDLATIVATQRDLINSLTNSIQTIYSNAAFITAFHAQYLIESSGNYFAPTTISFGTVTANSVVINLTTVTGATSYQIWSATDGTNYSLLSTLTNGVTTYTHSGLTANSVYYYKATATDGTKTSMAVSANIKTLTIDNSIASAGYTVIDYYKMSDKTVVYPSDGVGHTYGTVVELNGNAFTITNGVLSVGATPMNIRFSAIQGKTYKYTLYNCTTANVTLYDGNSATGVQVGNNVELVLVCSNTRGPDTYWDGTLSLSEIKVEVQN